MDSVPFWLVLLTFVLLQVVSILVIRTFPAVLGAMFVKKIEHQYATSLSRLKADLDASYSTLKTSVDFLSADQSELRSKTIRSVESLWTAVIEIDDMFSDIVAMDAIFIDDELADFFPSGDSRIREFLGAYDVGNTVSKKTKDLLNLTSEENRLFSGERLWLLFFIYRSAHGRMGFLIERSFKEMKFVNWKTDRGMDSIFRTILSEGVLDSARNMQFGGFREAMGHIKAEFLREAVRVISGSQHIADSLSDIQATLLHQKRLTENDFERKEST